MTAMLPPLPATEGEAFVDHDNAPLPPLQLDAAHGLMRVASTTLELRTTRAPELIDVTHHLEAFVAASPVAHGQLLVHSLHTTAAVITNEREPLLHVDIRTFLERLASERSAYRHDDFDVRTTNMTPDERANGHAHLRHLLLGASETFAVVRGRLVLGRWQRVFLVELDGARTRKVVLQLTGIRGY